ncbi:MAG: 3-deoxy-D-manno-octulosonic acid transferase, partial [Bacteroidota bacterium]|nr:3-deoxy-D-manno-octulosonic acid transferase [Bacteroidota bacterium]
YITYLPVDNRKSAEHFIKLIKPELVIFIKYEFWYHHLATVASNHIPLLLVSAVFRKEQVFFKWVGIFFRQMLFLFRHIFVQDESSFQLLQKSSITHSSVSGDTRFDRVTEIQEKFSAIDLIENFVGVKKTIVAGSTWEDDEVLLADYIKSDACIKMILAPHEMDAGHLAFLKNLFPSCILYTEFSEDTIKKDAQILIIDSVGLLSRLYQYGIITFVGGGFTKDGVHNILEAAVWGKPVVFGPNYKKYREAAELIKAGGGFSIRNSEELKTFADDFFSNEDHLQDAGINAKNYIEENTGATKKIVRFIQENRLLTN